MIKKKGIPHVTVSSGKDGSLNVKAKYSNCTYEIEKSGNTCYLTLTEPDGISCENKDFKDALCEAGLNVYDVTGKEWGIIL